MVWLGLVGWYGTGGHENTVWEGPNGQGTRYIGRYVNDGFLRKKKGQQKPVTKTTNKEETVQPKGTPPMHSLYEATSQKMQSKKNKKHTKSAEAAGPKIRPTRTTKIATYYHG